MGEMSDPRCPPGVNYLDWVINHLAPEDMTNGNVEDVIQYERSLRLKGGKPKKHVEKIDKEDIATLLRLSTDTKPQPTPKGVDSWRRI